MQKNHKKELPIRDQIQEVIDVILDRGQINDLQYV